MQEVADAGPQGRARSSCDVVPRRGLRHRRGVLHRRDGSTCRQGHSRLPHWSSATSGAAPSSAVGLDAHDESWVGQRVTGDTMLGCGQCRRCVGRSAPRVRRPLRARHPRSFPGALAEQARRPGHRPPTRCPTRSTTPSGAMVEPGGNAWRSLRGGRARARANACWSSGPGTIGLLVAEFARARGIEVHLAGRSRLVAGLRQEPRFRATSGRSTTCPTSRTTPSSTPPTAPACPAARWQLVEPGRRVVFIGLSGTPSLVDTRDDRAEGRHGGRHPRRVGRARGRHRELRVGGGRPAAARRSHGRPAPGPRRAGRLAARPTPDRARRSTWTRASMTDDGEAAMKDFDGLVAGGDRRCQRDRRGHGGGAGRAGSHGRGPRPRATPGDRRAHDLACDITDESDVEAAVERPAVPLRRLGRPRQQRRDRRDR